jgi:hypothetical protein
MKNSIAVPKKIKNILDIGGSCLTTWEAEIGRIMV